MSERERLYAAIWGVVKYRAHARGCEIDQTDFCTCGLREAMDHLNATWKAGETPAPPPKEER